MFDNAKFPSLFALLNAQLSIWPEHEPFFIRRFREVDTEHLIFADALARQILALTEGDLPDFCRSYRWICEAVLGEELYFRRNKKYRLTSFAEAYEQVYSRPEIMRPYMRGLLMTQVWWSNHTAAMRYYVNRFLAHNSSGYRHLEVGPGHGLLMLPAAMDNRCATVTAWDISNSSIEETRKALKRLGISREINLLVRDLFAPTVPEEQFDSVVFSEVLEHLEQPKAALDALRRAMAPGGRIFIHMPINSPAPDHIFLLRKPEQVQDFVASAGFDIEDAEVFPATGYTEAQARKLDLTISCVVTGRLSAK